MTPHLTHPCDPTPAEDLADAEALHGLEETAACRELSARSRMRPDLRRGLEAGRLTHHPSARAGTIRLTHRRLAYRHPGSLGGVRRGGGTWVVLRDHLTGAIVRLPYA